MFQEMTLEELQSKAKQGKLTIIDVRSPSEYEDSKIPNSVNIPVFDDEERKEVGTIYKQVSPKAARERGIEIFSAKLPQFINEVKELDGEKVVYCWRGGMRSKAAATVVDLAGTPVFRLNGGFRTYRNWVVNTLENFDMKPHAFVLNGYTGTGKTEILQKLKSEGYPVLDLEGMANHRGSIFGQIGRKPHNQKKFDSLLVHELLRYQDDEYVLMEGESKRIGKAVLPSFLMDKKDEGVQIYIELPKEERVRIILDEYQPWNYPEECIEAFHMIKKRIHTPVAKEIEQALHDENFEIAIELLLDYYYDPRYQHSITQYAEDQIIPIKAKNTEDATQQIKQLLTKKNVLH
ncbi:tRNA 2-selenouridine synthase [Salinibacillus kushneri]|uniref:tRNA 2-selenouridine synthase n=1 Tax=Salinibacillus kushneri TaxID=237682 RepID=A0A1I0BAY0_9BACI|nr:tRNA 2-selenouridine(34) synthase MnmH [Salinibacillus kushneri]SET03295.1 tRNA 2-selenouridine synthase [Salinibacillus kushneri]